MWCCPLPVRCQNQVKWYKSAYFFCENTRSGREIGRFFTGFYLFFALFTGFLPIFKKRPYHSGLVSPLGRLFHGAVDATLIGNPMDSIARHTSCVKRLFVMLKNLGWAIVPCRCSMSVPISTRSCTTHASLMTLVILRAPCRAMVCPHHRPGAPRRTSGSSRDARLPTT